MGTIQIREMWYVWSKQQLTVVEASKLTGADDQAPDCQHVEYKSLKIRVSSRKPWLAENIWQVSHGCDQKYIFLINVAPFKGEKQYKVYWREGIINQTQVSLPFVFIKTF